MDGDWKFTRKPEEVEDLEEVEEIVLGPVLDLDQGLAPEDEDLGPDLIQEDAQSPDQTLEIAPSHDLPGIQQETGLDPDQHPGLKTLIEIKMEIGPHPGKEKLQNLVHAPGPGPALDHDLEVIRTSKLDQTWEYHLIIITKYGMLVMY